MHTIDDRLRALGDALLRASAPITIDEVRDRGVPLLMVPDEEQGSADASMARRSPRLIWSAAAAVLVAVLVVVAMRGTDRSPSAAPSADGRMLLDATVDGWALVDLNDLLKWDPTSRSHLYVDTADPARAIQVQTFDADYMSPDLWGSSSVTLRDGRSAEIVNVPSLGGRSVAYEVDGVWVTVSSNAVADDVLIEMAGAVLPTDELTASIPPELIPTGFKDTGIVRGGEPNFVTDDAGEVGGPTMRWENGERSFWTYSVPGPESAGVMVAFTSSLERLDVRETDGAAFSRLEQPSFQGLAWVEGGRSFFAGSNGVTRDELVRLVERLRPVSGEEWDRAVASIAPPVAVLDPEAGLPAPGSLVPTRVTLFPYLPEDAIPAKGGRSTSAFYVHNGAGVETPGSSWFGAVAPGGTIGTGDDILIWVADRTIEAPGELPTVDGRVEGVSEYDSGDGVQLFTERDGVSISVQGSDKDVVYSLIEKVRPVVDDGVLGGYELVGELPAGLAVSAAPYGVGIETGSMPFVALASAFYLQVDRAPVDIVVARDGGPFELVSTPLGDAWLSERGFSEIPGQTVFSAVVGLEDGTTLWAQSQLLTKEEFLRALGSVQLVDRAAWEAIYDPTPAIVPRLDDAPAVTVTEQT
jgi:hypothetical protein